MHKTPNILDWQLFFPHYLPHFLLCMYACMYIGLVAKKFEAFAHIYQLCQFFKSWQVAKLVKIM